MKLYRIASIAALLAATAIPAAAQCAGTTCSWTQAQPSTSYSSYTSSSYGASSYAAPAAQRMPGLAADEYLCPTTCPTSVNVPAGGRVLDCFNICKKEAPAPVYTPSYQTYTQAYQVVRPVVYVNYPVPVALPSCPIYDAPSRYGSRYNHDYAGRCGN